MLWVIEKCDGRILASDFNEKRGFGDIYPILAAMPYATARHEMS